MWGTEGEQSFSDLDIINTAKCLPAKRQIWSLNLEENYFEICDFWSETFVGTTYMQDSTDDNAVHENCCIAYMQAQK